MRLFSPPLLFESLVNTEGFQTSDVGLCRITQFESLVNTEGFQTAADMQPQQLLFESLVNTEGFQTSKGYTSLDG